MKALLSFAFVLALSASALAKGSATGKSQAAAQAAAEAIMKINFPGDKIVSSIVSSDSSGEEPGAVETVVIRAHTEDQNGHVTSAQFQYSIKLLEGSVWVVTTECPLCS